MKQYPLKSFIILGFVVMSLLFMGDTSCGGNRGSSNPPAPTNFGKVDIILNYEFAREYEHTSFDDCILGLVPVPIEYKIQWYNTATKQWNELTPNFVGVGSGVDFTVNMPLDWYLNYKIEIILPCFDCCNDYCGGRMPEDFYFNYIPTEPITRENGKLIWVYDSLNVSVTQTSFSSAVANHQIRALMSIRYPDPCSECGC